MDKEEIIKQSYGEYYDIVKDLIDDFGWLQISKYEDKFDELFDDIEMIDYFNYELELNFSRPKEIEIWKPVINYEGIYEVSDLGRCRVFERNRKNFKTVITGSKTTIKKLTKSNHGYNMSTFCKDGARKLFLISRISYLAFNGKLTKGLVIDHRNNKRDDDRLINLQQITYRKNTSKDRKNKISKFTGVYLTRKTMRWRAMIKIKDKSVNLGSFATEEEASEAYQKAKNENP